MGFSDYFIQNVSSTPDATPKDRKPKSLQSTEDNKMSDQEILEGIERIYFEENADLATYELKVMRCSMCHGHYGAFATATVYTPM